LDKGGYGNIWYEGKSQKVHRVAYLVFKGPIPKGLHVRHSCDTRPCCEPTHLSVGTNLDNVMDRVSRDRTPKGSSCFNAKLTEDAVVEIRRLYASGNYSHRKLGTLYGVSHTTIAHAISYTQWKHVA
jgi:hypothetical protein